MNVTFNSNGFTLGNASSSNFNGNDFVSWTFRKAPKFFDVVTYSGQNTDLALSHNLGVAPGMVIVKRTDTSGDWYVYHRSLNLSENLTLNSIGDVGGNNFWTSSAPSSTVFNIDGNRAAINQSGGSYVAYLFAHNNSDGGFGPDADQDIIKCGSYTGTGSEMFVDLGFEPQFFLTKRTDSFTDWFIVDVMRGMAADQADPYLRPNQQGAEANTGGNGWHPSPTGITIQSSSQITSGANYIYMAIRRGPLAEPESATDVFAIDQGDTTSTDPQFISNFPVDMGIYRYVAGAAEHNIGSRITGATYGQTQNTNAFSGDGDFTWDYMNGWYASTRNTSHYSWMWKRAPGYFDVVAYSGDGTSSNTINHNLGVVPEMMWFKRRDSSTAGNWLVYHNSYLTTQALFLNSNGALISSQTGNLQSTPTNSSFTVGSYNGVNNSSGKYIAYLFATVAGVSKVGSYTGNGSSQTIDCGFSSGARFVLIKSSTQATEWNVFDTARGIVSGNDPALFLDNTSAEVTNGDFIDPHSSGFTINYVTTLQGCNTSGQSYIFYAIA